MEAFSAASLRVARAMADDDERDDGVPTPGPPGSLEELRRLGEQVKGLSSHLPGHEDDVADIVATASGVPAEPGQPAVAGPVADEAVAEELEAQEYLADVVPSTPLDAVPLEDETPLEDEAPGLFDDVHPLEPSLPPRDHRVVAVLVAHDGARWLPAVLTALSRATRRPDVLVAVDTGSTDTTADLLAQARTAGVVDDVVTAPRDSGFGAAVAAGLAVVPGAGVAAPDGEPAVEWVWLLHDDSAPDPAALEALLLTADRNRSAEVLGPKVRGWANRTHLVEAGVTVARSGNRWTGLERRELDQGQHDGDRDVLAVGSAGMLVRRDVWDALEGFDPALPFFRDDVDFCWRARVAGYRVLVATDAVVHHRAAATHRRRPVDAGSPRHPERPERVDRVSAIHLMRAHSRGLRGPWGTLRMLVGSLLRALGLLLAKAPDAARDEWGAFRDAVRDRSGLKASRARVAAAAAMAGAVPEKEVRALLAPRGAQVRHAFETVADLVAGRDGGDVQRSVLDSTSDDPDGWYADDKRPSRIRRWFTRPGTLTVLGLLLVALVGVRSLLVGDGELVGGALVPAPDGAMDLWAAYTTAWHEVGVGSAAEAPAWLLPLFLLAGVLRGSATTAVDVLLLLVVPLSGLSAWLATRGLRISAPARIWAVAAYATLPAVTGALSAGRIGSAASLVLLPWLARSVFRLIGFTGPVTWRRAFGTGLLLAVVVSFTPVVWPIVVVLAVVAGVTVRRDAGARVRLAVATLLPVAMLVPWSLRVLREPGLLLLEPGLTGPVDRSLSAVDVLLLRPGGPGSTPLWLGAGIVLAGLACLGVPGGRRTIGMVWAVGMAGLVAAVVMTVVRVTVPSVDGPIAPWPGVPTALWAGALILAVALTVDRLPDLLAGRDFGWRQPAVVVLAVLLVLAPVGSAALLVVGADGPLRRSADEVVPAFVAAEMQTPTRPRALVLQRAGGAVVYDLLSTTRPQLSDPDVAASTATSAVVDRLVARLVAGIGASEVDDLADHGVRYVVLADARPEDDPVVEALDSQRGLRRLASREGDTLWELIPKSGRALTVATRIESGVQVRVAGPVPTTSGDLRTPTAVDRELKPGPADRSFVLAEAADPRWRWTVAGEPVDPAPPSVDGVADPSLQRAPIPSTATSVAISFDWSERTRWLWAQGAVVLLVVLLALPSRRRVDDDEDEELGAEEVPA